MGDDFFSKEGEFELTSADGKTFAKIVGDCRVNEIGGAASEVDFDAVGCVLLNGALGTEADATVGEAMGKVFRILVGQIWVRRNGCGCVSDGGLVAELDYATECEAVARAIIDEEAFAVVACGGGLGCERWFF